MTESKRRKLIKTGLGIFTLPAIAACNNLLNPDLPVPFHDPVPIPTDTDINVPGTRLTLFLPKGTGAFVGHYSPSGIKELNKIIADNNSVILHLHEIDPLNPLNNRSDFISSYRVPRENHQRCEGHTDIYYAAPLFEEVISTSKDRLDGFQNQIISQWNTRIKSRLYWETLQIQNLAKSDLCDRKTKNTAGFSDIEEIATKLYPVWFNLRPGIKLSQEPLFQIYGATPFKLR